MNNIIQSPLAADPNKQQVLTIPDLLFMEAGIKEAFLNTVLGIIGNSYSTSTPYVLFGCIRTGTPDGTGGTVSITAGSIFYNGEIYTIPSVTILLTTGQYVVGSITTTYGTAEVLKDGTSTNVQQINQINFTGGASGSGTFNQASCEVITAVNHNNIVSIIDTCTSGNIGYNSTLTPLCSFVPSANNVANLKISVSGDFSNSASSGNTGCSLYLYVGGTLSGHTDGSAGGTLTGGTLLKTVFFSSPLNSVNVNPNFITLLSYTGGTMLTLLASFSGTVAADVSLLNGIDMIAEGII